MIFNITSIDDQLILFKSTVSIRSNSVNGKFNEASIIVNWYFKQQQHFDLFLTLMNVKLFSYSH
jgi:hypothetical protein